MNLEYIHHLEKIADLHINPHPVHRLDRMIQSLDVEQMLPYVQGPWVLELGVGDGAWTEKMLSQYGSSFVVDGSQKLLEYAQQRFGEKLCCFHALFEEFNPPDNLKFNTILATHILEHVDDPVFVLRRCRNWLALDGVIIIIVPNANSLHRELAVLMGIQQTVYELSPRDIEVGHQRVYDLALLHEHAHAAGYDILVEKGLLLKVLPYSMMVDFSDKLLKAMVDISTRLPIEWMGNLAMVLKAKKEDDTFTH